MLTSCTINKFLKIVILQNSKHKTEKQQNYKAVKNKITIITKHYKIVTETYGELTSEYTVSQIMIIIQ